MMGHGDARAGDYVSRLCKIVSAHAQSLGGGAGEALMLHGEVLRLKWTLTSATSSSILAEVRRVWEYGSVVISCRWCVFSDVVRRPTVLVSRRIPLGSGRKRPNQPSMS